MKKLFAILLTVLVLLSIFPVGTFAVSDVVSAYFPQGMPNFQLLDGYAGYIQMLDNESDAYNDAKAVLWLRVPASIVNLESAYNSDSDAFLERYGLSDCHLYVQIDVSVDSDSSWQYTEDWDDCQAEGLGNGYDYLPASFTYSLNSNVVPVTAFDLYNGDPNGIFDNMTETFVNSDGVEVKHLDLDNHTIWMKVRYVVEYTTDEAGGYITEQVPGVWSDAFSVGKSGVQDELVAPETISAPTISNLTIEFNSDDGSEAAAVFDVSIHSSFDDAVIYNEINLGYSDFEIVAQYSIDGGEWIENSIVNSESLNAGKRRVLIGEGFNENSAVMLRVFLRSDTLTSDFSNVISINAGNVTMPADSGDSGASAKSDDKCPLCGICPVQPLGICLFIWIAAALVVIIVIVVIVKKSKKK